MPRHRRLDSRRLDTDRPGCGRGEPFRSDGRRAFHRESQAVVRAFDRVADGACAVSVLDNPVRRRQSAAVFPKNTVRRELSSIAGVGPRGRTAARLDLNWDQLIRSVDEVIWFPPQAMAMGHQWTLDVATTVCVLVDDAALQNPAIQESPAGVRAQEQSDHKY